MVTKKKKTVKKKAPVTMASLKREIKQLKAQLAALTTTHDGNNQEGFSHVS